MTDVCHFVLLIDDLEYEPQRSGATRSLTAINYALNTLLNTLKHRASVHFLVNMLEAYYFADAQCDQRCLGNLLARLSQDDVETIRNPKSDLRIEHILVSGRLTMAEEFLIRLTLSMFCLAPMLALRSEPCLLGA